jgi:succinate-semialdehyde dehydrogenase/glutarate-semialdehyde dehydrogenase
MSVALSPRPAAAPAPAERLPGALREWEAVAWVPTGLLLGEGFRDAAEGRTLEVEDPSTGAPLCSVADAGEADALAALAAAAEAQAGWAARPPRERARMLRRAADALDAERERIALVVTLEMGKPLAESLAEVDFAVEYLEWFAGEATRLGGACGTAPSGDGQLLVRRRPVGPALVVTPWNFPLLIPVRGLAPALAAGCTAVLRPSRLTPLSALALARVLLEAGLPPGVLGVVVASADGATDPLLADPRLRKLTFTGSTAVGRGLLARAAEQFVRVTAELGGQAPFVVFADADLDAAVEGALQAKMRNGGAACTAANRFLVQRDVAEEFTARLSDRVGGVRLGRGTEPGVDLGPMIGGAQRDRLAALVDDAVARGARVALDGGPVAGPGHFLRPVVLADVPDAARASREEVFGPVAAIRTFGTEAEALRVANASSHGLAGYVYTRDLDRGLRVADALEVGMVGLNQGRVSSVAAPFGGLRHSGLGRSGGDEGLAEYLETSYLAIAAG